MKLLADILIAALATGALIDVWLTGSIFNSSRRLVRTWQQRSVNRTPPGWPPRANLLLELITCPYCLSYWVGAICFTLTQLDATWGIPAALAAIRLGNLVNSLLPPELQYNFEVHEDWSLSHDRTESESSGHGPDEQ